MAGTGAGKSHRRICLAGYAVTSRGSNVHLALVPLQNLRRGWSFQNWVCEAIQGLNHPRMFAVEITLEDSITQMTVVAAAWGNARSTVAVGPQVFEYGT